MTTPNCGTLLVTTTAIPIAWSPMLAARREARHKDAFLSAVEHHQLHRCHKVKVGTFCAICLTCGWTYDPPDWLSLSA